MFTYLLDHQGMYAVAGLIPFAVTVALIALVLTLRGTPGTTGTFLLIVSTGLGLGFSVLFLFHGVNAAQTQALEHRYGVPISGHLDTEPGPIRFDGHTMTCKLNHPGTDAKLLCQDALHEPARR